MMKRIIVGVILALPFAITALSTQQASAESVIVNPHFHTQASRPTLIASAHRVRIAGHWQGMGRHRRWIPAHYEYR